MKARFDLFLKNFLLCHELRTSWPGLWSNCSLHEKNVLIWNVKIEYGFFSSKKDADFLIDSREEKNTITLRKAGFGVVLGLKLESSPIKKAAFFDPAFSKWLMESFD
jgi:hypothetical protein